jgi:hypothetical protein
MNALLGMSITYKGKRINSGDIKDILSRFADSCKKHIKTKSEISARSYAFTEKAAKTVDGMLAMLVFLEINGTELTCSDQDTCRR